MGKKRNREDKEDRTIIYRDERREYDGYSQDVDQLEFSFYGDEIIFVVSLELTRVDYNPKYPNGPTKKYFDAILERFHYDSQAKISKKVAERLGIESYIVAFYHNMEKLWVYNLTQERGWKRFTREEYFKWLEKKHHSAILKRINEDKELNEEFAN